MVVRYLVRPPPLSRITRERYSLSSPRLGSWRGRRTASQPCPQQGHPKPVRQTLRALRLAIGPNQSESLSASLDFYLSPRLPGMTTVDHATGDQCARRSPVAPPPMRSSGRPRLLPRSALRPRSIVAPSEFACSVDRTRVDVSDSGRISQNVHGDCSKGEGSREIGTTHNPSRDRHPFSGQPDSFICGPYKDCVLFTPRRLIAPGDIPQRKAPRRSLDRRCCIAPASRRVLLICPWPY